MQHHQPDASIMNRMTKACAPAAWQITRSTVSLTLLSICITASTSQAEWKPVRCIPADLPPQALYEPVTPVTIFGGEVPQLNAASGGQQAAAVVHRDASLKHGDSASLRVDYTFAADKELEYIQLTGARIVFTNTSQILGFWYKGGTANHPVKLRLLDVSGECHQLECLSKPSTNWQFVVCKLDSGNSAWGGDGNKKLDFPCRFDSLCLDRPHAGFKGKGSIWIDEMSLIQPVNRAVPQIAVTTDTWLFGNAYPADKEFTLRAQGEGDRIEWSLRDFFGKELQQGNGPAQGTDIHLHPALPGWYSCRMTLRNQQAPNNVIAEESFNFSVLSPETPTPTPFFGVCTHFGQNAYPLEVMDLLKLYGIGQFRDEVSWGSVEETKGHHALPDYAARFLNRASDLGLQPLLIYDYAHSFYDNGGFPNSQESIDAFARYAVALTRETRGKVHMFEIWNEWIGACGMEGRPGKHDAEAYGRLLKPVYNAVKKQFPDVTVVGIGGEYGTDCATNIVKAIRVAGPRSMDAWSIHPYRYPEAPETSDLAGEIARITQAVRQTTEPSHPWITEIGYPTHLGNNGVDEATQARYVIRTLALLQGSRAVDKLFWYDFKDDGLNRDYNEHNFGLIHHETYNCAPKPATVAIQAYARFTSDAAFIDCQQKEGTVIVTAQKKHGGQVRILWCPKGHDTVSLSSEKQRAFDFMGNPIQNAKRTIAIDDTPIYLVEGGSSANTEKQ
jgi:hypothetical protein